MVIRTPGGYSCSRMSRARRIVWQNEVTRRLSGGDVNVRRYTEAAGDVTMTVPLALVALGEARIGSWNSVVVAISMFEKGNGKLRGREKQEAQR